MTRQFLLHGCDVDDSAISHSPTGPGIKQLLLLLLLFLRVPLDPASQQSIQDLVDLHLLPLGRHEVSLGRRMRSERERIIVIMANLEGGIGDSLRCHLATADSVNQFELFVIESNVTLVELISNGPPPILVLGLADKLANAILLLLLGHLLQVLIVTEVLELVVPSIGDATDLHLGQLVLLVVGVILTDLTRRGLLLGTLPLQTGLACTRAHPSPMIIVQSQTYPYHTHPSTATPKINRHHPLAPSQPA